MIIDVYIAILAIAATGVIGLVQLHKISGTLNKILKKLK